MNILVIAAHPDDDILGMGGTMLMHSNKGDKIRTVYLATGIAARRTVIETENQSKDSKKENEKINTSIKKLRVDAKQALKILKISDVMFYDFPDNEMDSSSLLKIVKTIEKEIKIHKPSRIYTNHYGDLNVDHRTVFNATLTACRPTNKLIKELICFEVPSSTEWNYPPQFRPNYFVNIQTQLSKKIIAMKMYKSELRKFPHPRSVEYLTSLARKWGATCGMNAAEAFEIVRKIE